MRALSTLYMNQNTLNGVPIPLSKEACRCDGLSDGNRRVRCAGSLPASWSQMPVQELDLMNNTLSGLLPPAWGSAASKLTSLSLGDNLFTGGAAHSNFTWMLHLHISLLCAFTYNCFGPGSGCLPAEYASIPYLRFLGIHTNELTGALQTHLTANYVRMFQPTFCVGDLCKVRAGTLPAVYSQLQLLEELWLADNTLRGALKLFSYFTKLAAISGDLHPVTRRVTAACMEPVAKAWHPFGC